MRVVRRAAFQPDMRRAISFVHPTRYILGEVNLRTIFSSCILLVLWMVPLASAQTGMLTSNPVFQKNCAKCNGKTAEGRHFGGPSLVSEDVRKTSTDELRGIITNGRHHMPKYQGKLTPEEIDTLVSQIKSEK